jgi:uncharacterized damage-inducible protein DinB
MAGSSLAPGVGQRERRFLLHGLEDRAVALRLLGKNRAALSLSHFLTIRDKLVRTARLVDDSKAIGERLRGQLDALAHLIEGVPRADLDKRVAGKWSVTENAAHLARYTELTIERVRRILTDPEPTFPPYRAEQDAEWPAWQSRSFEDVVERLHATRADLAALVRNLTPEQLARKGRHARFGPMSLRAWLEFFLAHEGHHFYVILKRAHGAE